MEGLISETESIIADTEKGSAIRDAGSDTCRTESGAL